MITFATKSKAEVAKEVSDHKQILNAKFQEIQKFYFDQIIAKKVTKEELLFS